jgi:hypothetical protein
VRNLTVTGARLVLVLCSGLFGLSVCAAAQVSGVVTDSANRPIASAKIQSNNQAVVTDESGSFRLEKCVLPCSVEVSAKGFAPPQAHTL